MTHCSKKVVVNNSDTIGNTIWLCLPSSCTIHSHWTKSKYLQVTKSVPLVAPQAVVARVQWTFTVVTETTEQKNYINGPRRIYHGLELHTLIHGTDYVTVIYDLAPMWWKVWKVEGWKGGVERGWESGGWMRSCVSRWLVCASIRESRTRIWSSWMHFHWTWWVHNINSNIILLLCFVTD